MSQHWVHSASIGKKTGFKSGCVNWIQNQNLQIQIFTFRNAPYVERDHLDLSSVFTLGQGNKVRHIEILSSRGQGRTRTAKEVVSRIRKGTQVMRILRSQVMGVMGYPLVLLRWWQFWRGR